MSCVCMFAQRMCGRVCVRACSLTQNDRDGMEKELERLSQHITKKIEEKVSEFGWVRLGGQGAGIARELGERSSQAVTIEFRHRRIRILTYRNLA
jgi:hypothetical protein